MGNFYGKRFLSSLLGALSVLSSPVASAREDKLGKGNLKGEVESSAGRSKNNGKLGELEADRKVKSIDGLKGVLKETGGEVVRVSPDGKGGFVAFVKTPRGIVTVAIVGVPLLVVLSLVAHYVFSGRKNDDAGKKNLEIMNETYNPETVVKNATGRLLKDLFNSDQDKYDSFVERLFEGFFNDAEEVLKGKFDECKGDLDEFLRVVFERSKFDYCTWIFDRASGYAPVSWVSDNSYAVGFDSKHIEPLKSVFDYLSENSLVNDFPVCCEQAVWRDKISAILFSFWCFVEFGLDVGSDDWEVESKLKEQEINKLSNTFNIIEKYVEERLKAAGKGYDGEKLPLV